MTTKPKPAPGAKRYAVIERSRLQGGGYQRLPDTETEPLFPEGDSLVDSDPEATKAAEQFDGLF